MYYIGEFKCQVCDATLVVKMDDWVDLGSGSMTPGLRKKLEGWTYKKGMWRCPLHKVPPGDAWGFCPSCGHGSSNLNDEDYYSDTKISCPWCGYNTRE